MESEGHEEKYRAVIDGETQDEPVGQRWGKVESDRFRLNRVLMAARTAAADFVLGRGFNAGYV